MTTVTAELIDNVYDAITLMSLFAQRLSEGEISDTEAGEMSWMLGSTKKRLEPVIEALEDVERAQRNPDPRENEDLIQLGSEILALHAKFQRCRQGLKEAAE
jgi:hypothetical protein